MRPSRSRQVTGAAFTQATIWFQFLRSDHGLRFMLLHAASSRLWDHGGVS